MAGSGTAHLRPADQSLLRIEDLVVEFPVGRTGLKVNAVSKVSIDVLPGETLGLVGESGCGKSTMGKAVMQLVGAKSGSVLFEGNELNGLKGELLRALRPKLQMIFQDPISSLNPRRRVRDIVREGLDIWKIGDKESRAKRVDEVLDTVGIDPSVAGPKRPHEFSGGQCQRISIARAVATEPKLIICDEPVSALDVSVQAQILNLLEDMKRTYGLTLVFIAHDLAVVKNVSDKVAVMYLGKLCEFAQPDALYASPAHPYTAALLSAIPEPDPQARTEATAGVRGEIPSPVSPPSGCRFRTRCPLATDTCAAEEPQMREVRPGHFVACHYPLGDITITPGVPGAAEAPTNGGGAPSMPATAPVAVGTAAVASMPTDGPEPMQAAPDVTPAAAPPAPPLAPPPLVPPPLTPADPPAPSPVPATEPEPQPPATPESPWVASSPVSPDAPELVPPASAPAPPPPLVDWTPEPPQPAPAPEPVVASPPPPPPPPPPAPAPVAPPERAEAEEDEDEDEAPESLEAPAPTIPDVTALDTLLPDRSRGGSIKPGS
ncbi:MAG: oligopeptide/dipeptide ABC transporter ATP-binding protein [Acidimicrobiia bacterium]